MKKPAPHSLRDVGASALGAPKNTSWLRTPLQYGRKADAGPLFRDSHGALHLLIAGVGAVGSEADSQSGVRPVRQYCFGVRAANLHLRGDLRGLAAKKGAADGIFSTPWACRAHPEARSASSTRYGQGKSCGKTLLGLRT